MLSPPLTAPRRTARAADAGRRPRRALVLGLLTTLAAVAFVFAPVHQPEVSYSWTPADGSAVALPLMPYQPTALTSTVGCAAARRGGVLLSTVPPRPDPAAPPLSGLQVVGTPAGVAVTSAGVPLGTVALPAGDCTLTTTSDARATTVALDGAPVLVHPGDVRPDVAGIFTEAGDGLALSLVADTRFATTPTALKLALGALCLVGLVALGGVLAGADRAGPTRRARLLPRRWWRPRPVDAAVAALLGAWWVVGAGTVDDGYVAGIVRGRGDNGFVGNVYRWLNAPEAPFSWYDEPLAWWASVSPSTPWLRLPSTLLGLLCWALVSRLLLPRLGAAGRRRATRWVAALAFATWWVPFGLGLRPEPWVAVGLVLAVLGVERAVALHRLLPLAAALGVAGATTALTPGGLMAFAPVLAAAVPLLRVLRARTDMHLGRSALPLVAALVAPAAAALLLMAYDQGAAALAEAVRVRGVIGGGRPWHEESARYALLVTPDDLRGAVGRRAAVLATILAAVGLAWTRPPAPVRRLLVTLGLAALAMMVTPTKWTQHFGDLIGVGAAVLALGLVVFGRRALTALDPGTARRRWVAGLAGATLVGGQVLGGQNQWPFVSGWYTPTFSTLPPLVSVPGVVTDLPVATLFVAAGGAVVAALVARSVWWRATAPTPRGDASRVALLALSASSATLLTTPAPPGPPPRGIPAPATPLALVLAAALALQVLGLVRVAAAHPDGYTPTADAVATLAGDPCGLQSALLVEADPAAGALPPAPGRPGWYALDARQRTGALPVVVTAAGQGVAVEFSDGTRVALPASVDPADRRLPAPPGADAVRLTVTGAAAVASPPRAPVLTPMTELLPRGTRAVLDWPVAFVFPCLDPAPLPPGTAGLPAWRVAPPPDDGSAGITYTPGLGGPFAGPRALVTQHRLPTYVRGDLLSDKAPQLYRWDPVAPMRTLAPKITTRTVISPFTQTHLRVLPPS